MKIYQTAVGVDEEGTGIVTAYTTIDTIEYAGRFWLVPTWLEKPLAEYKSPEVLISLEGLPHKRIETAAERTKVPADFLLLIAIPKPFLQDLTQLQRFLPIDVIPSPDIKVTIPSGIH